MVIRHLVRLLKPPYIRTLLKMTSRSGLTLRTRVQLVKRSNDLTKIAIYIVGVTLAGVTSRYMTLDFPGHYIDIREGPCRECLARKKMVGFYAALFADRGRVCTEPWSMTWPAAQHHRRPSPLA